MPWEIESLSWLIKMKGKDWVKKIVENLCRKWRENLTNFENKTSFFLLIDKGSLHA